MFGMLLKTMHKEVRSALIFSNYTNPYPKLITLSRQIYLSGLTNTFETKTKCRIS